MLTKPIDETTISFLFGNTYLGLNESVDEDGKGCVTIELKNGKQINYQNLTLLGLYLETRNISMERRLAGLGGYDRDATWNPNLPARLVCHC